MCLTPPLVALDVFRILMLFFLKGGISPFLKIDRFITRNRLCFYSLFDWRPMKILFALSFAKDIIKNI
jgi:hypothetical protein